MSRIRTTKPEFWKDEKIGRLSLRARLLFMATWNFADDMGTARAMPAYLRAEIFPYDDASLVEITAALGELEREDLVRVFQDQGQSYLSIHHWARHQRINNPSGAKYPDPPRNLWDSVSPTVALPEGYHGEGKGREGSGREQNQNPRVRAKEFSMETETDTADASVIALNPKAGRA
jgi:hypothetical protein